jgi:hypothetical protein
MSKDVIVTQESRAKITYYSMVLKTNERKRLSHGLSIIKMDTLVLETINNISLNINF